MFAFKWNFSTVLSSLTWNIKFFAYRSGSVQTSYAQTVLSDWKSLLERAAGAEPTELSEAAPQHITNIISLKQVPWLVHAAFQNVVTLALQIKHSMSSPSPSLDPLAHIRFVLQSPCWSQLWIYLLLTACGCEANGLHTLQEKQSRAQAHACKCIWLKS